MKALKEHLNTIITALFELIVGILLLINPVSFTVGIIMAAGAVMMVYGALQIIRYFRTEVRSAAASQTLAQGLGLMLMGAFCAFRSDWFLATFPVLTIIYGVTMLFGGLSKVQFTVDLFRLKNQKWFWGAISAAVSIVCALLILYSPFTSAALLWMFTSISLIAEAVIDFIALFVSRRDAAA